MTRSLPATMVAPPSVATLLAVSRNLLASLPLASRRQKHFWLARMVAMITSSGTARKLASNAAHHHHRPFDEAGDFLEQALVGDDGQALREGEVVGVGADDVLAAVEVEHDLGLLERGGRSRRSGGP